MAPSSVPLTIEFPPIDQMQPPRSDMQSMANLVVAMALQRDAEDTLRNDSEISPRPDGSMVVVRTQEKMNAAAIDHPVAREDVDLSAEDWLTLEGKSLKAEAAEVSRSLEDTLAYVRDRCEPSVRMT